MSAGEAAPIDGTQIGHDLRTWTREVFLQEQHQQQPADNRRQDEGQGVELAPEDKTAGNGQIDTDQDRHAPQGSYVAGGFFQPPWPDQRRRVLWPPQAADAPFVERLHAAFNHPVCQGNESLCARHHDQHRQEHGEIVRCEPTDWIVSDLRRVITRMVLSYRNFAGQSTASNQLVVKANESHWTGGTTKKAHANGRTPLSNMPYSGASSYYKLPSGCGIALACRKNRVLSILLATVGWAE